MRNGFWYPKHLTKVLHPKATIPEQVYFCWCISAKACTKLLFICSQSSQFVQNTGSLLIEKMDAHRVTSIISLLINLIRILYINIYKYAYCMYI